MALAPEVRQQIVDAVRTGVSQDREQRRDPYRIPLNYLLAAMALCVALIVAMLSALAKTPLNAIFERTIGGAFSWTAATLLLTIVVVIILQAMRAVRWWRQNTNMPNVFVRFVVVVMMLAPVIPGLGILSYAVRGGAALVTESKRTVEADKTPDNGTLPGFWESVCIVMPPLPQKVPICQGAG